MGRLHQAIRRSSETAVLRLLSDGLVHADECSGEGEPAIHAACRIGMPMVVEELLRQGVAADCVGLHGRQCLHVVAMTSQTPLVDLLVIKGARVGCIDEKGKTPLHRAAAAGEAGMVAKLLEHDADVSAADLTGRVPLHDAAWEGHAAVIGILLQAGADIYAQDHQGDTPLHLAASQGRLAAARALLEHGADASLTNAAGHTPADLASSAGNRGGQFLEWRRPCQQPLRRTAGDEGTALCGAVATGDSDAVTTRFNFAVVVRARGLSNVVPIPSASADVSASVRGDLPDDPDHNPSGPRCAAVRHALLQ